MSRLNSLNQVDRLESSKYLPKYERDKIHDDEEKSKRKNSDPIYGVKGLKTRYMNWQIK